MITASIVAYNHHLLDIEPVLRSLIASPVDLVWIIDHSEDNDLEAELQNYINRVFTSEKSVVERVENGFRIEYLCHENNGYGGGHNVALRKASAMGVRYHLVVNPDIWFGPRVIPTLSKYMDEHPDVAQMMPLVLYPNGSVQPLAKMLPSPIDFFGRLCLPPRLIAKRNRWFELKDSNYKMILNVPYLSGCFMFLRIKAMEKIVFFDEHFFMYAEDIDVTRRLHVHYKTIFYPDVSVFHKFSRASRRDLGLFYVHVKNIIMYLNKWGWFKDPQRDVFNQTLEKQIKEGGIQ